VAYRPVTAVPVIYTNYALASEHPDMLCKRTIDCYVTTTRPVKKCLEIQSQLLLLNACMRIKSAKSGSRESTCLARRFLKEIPHPSMAHLQPQE
jgi:hypothetical protein